MTETCADLIQRVRTRLLSGQGEALNQLAADVDDAQGTFTVKRDISNSGLVDGARVAVDVESMYVWASDASAKSVEVQRAMDGTLAAAHAAGALVTINPKFPDWLIFQAINDTINGYSSDGFYEMRTVDIVSNPSVYGYDLTDTTDVLNVYKVCYQATGPEARWPRLRFAWDANMNTDSFPSGNAVILREMPEPGRTFRVWYRVPFRTFATVDDEFAATTGMPANTSDLPALGAAALVLGAREAKRSFGEAQGDSRRAQEVPAGSAARAASVFQAQHQLRLAAEVRRLRQKYPDLSPIS